MREHSPNTVEPPADLATVCRGISLETRRVLRIRLFLQCGLHAFIGGLQDVYWLRRVFPIIYWNQNVRIA